MTSRYIFLFLTTLSIILSTGCSKDDKDMDIPDIPSDTITIGALLSLTGNWSTLGKTSELAMEIALDDINLFMQDIGSGYRFTGKVYDTKLEVDQAVEAIEAAKSEGIRFLVGPQSSSELAAVKTFADDNAMYVVSQGSTAGSLSIPDDNIFRFCPDGQLEGEALAQTIYDSGVRGLVTVARDDVGNTGLKESIDQAFTDLGGTIYDMDHYADNISDFDPVIASLEDHLNTAIGAHGSDAVGVYIAAFDEAVDLFAAANDHQVLNSVQWFGGDGITRSEAFTDNELASQFAIKTGFFAPEFGLPSAAASFWEPLQNEIETQTGIEPGAFALATYDALWVIALTYHASDVENQSESITREIFHQNADEFSGVTGSTLLNENGDRTVASFWFWGIEESNGSFSWVQTGSSE